MSTEEAYFALSLVLHRQRSLVGYSPWGLKESDTTEQLHFHFTSSVGSGENTYRCWKIAKFPSVTMQNNGITSLKCSTIIIKLYSRILYSAKNLSNMKTKYFLNNKNKKTWVIPSPRDL